MQQISSLVIREETPADYPEVEAIIKQAFSDEIHSGGTEHELVRRLRKTNAFIPGLSLVAVLEDRLVGHILLTRVHIRNEQQQCETLALAPVSVHPEFQGKGIGGKLIITSHQKAKKLGFSSILLIGHDAYYPRFGYRPAHSFGITFPFDAPPENCMAAELIPGALDKIGGHVVYPDVFFEDLKL